MKPDEAAALRDEISDLRKQVTALVETVRDLVARQPMVIYCYTQPWVTTPAVSPYSPTITYTLSGGGATISGSSAS